MSQNSLRLANLLGEMRRQMNGAVVGGMRFYGAEYGLNYGVSIPTIRNLARGEVRDHSFARLLYRQEVRELRLAAFWVADSEAVADELEFWARGIVNSEVAEEAAFALFCRVPSVDEWLQDDSELLRYCAVMSIAHRPKIELSVYRERLVVALGGEVHILPSAVVALLDAALKCGVQRGEVESILSQIPQNNAGAFVREEMAWRLAE